jgi:uncharacterized protein YbjT (DUF2867 family)
MATYNIKILVHGATGAQARPLIDKLQEAGYKPFALTRNRQQASSLPLQAQQLLEISINDKEGIYQATQGMDVVILTIPFFADNDAGINAMDAAKAAGAKLLIWNTSGAIPHNTSGNHGLNVRMYNMEHLVALGIPYIVFQPTIYLENLLLPETAKRIANHNTIEYPAAADASYPWMSADDMATYMFEAIQRPDLVGSVFTVAGEPLTGEQLAVQFTFSLGRPIRYGQISLEEYASRLNKQLGEEAGKAIMGAESAKAENRQALYPPLPVVHAKDVLGLPLQSLQSWILKYARHFA